MGPTPMSYSRVTAMLKRPKTASRACPRKADERAHIIASHGSDNIGKRK